MSPLLFALTAALAIAGGVHLVVLARGTFRTWLALIRTPTAKIGEAETGLVELSGKVVLPDGGLASRDDESVPEGAELSDSGG